MNDLIRSQLAKTKKAYNADTIINQYYLLKDFCRKIDINVKLYPELKNTIDIELRGVDVTVQYTAIEPDENVGYLGEIVIEDVFMCGDSILPLIDDNFNEEIADIIKIEKGYY